MKRNFLVLILVAIPFITEAQFALGIKAGTTSRYDFTLDEGFDVGVFARFGNVVYFQPELLYHNVSTNIFEDCVFGENVHITYHYISIPMLACCNVINLNNVKFRILCGPKVSFCLGYDKYEGGTYPDMTDAVVGLQAGIGVDLWRFTFDFRYDGLSTRVSNNFNDEINKHHFNVALGFKIIK
ncbi:MAG: porin family protein [Bacteroidales bacterium]|nr:porin family protein [Bacteroidales bacterium]